MEWHLAGYGSHPIDGDAGRVAELASHLSSITSDIRSQVGRIRALNSGDFWESSAGSADAFQEVVEDLPEKLDLVATRYETVAGALDLFHPTLANTKQDAEFWIQKAAEAHEEIERAESGIELMEDFEAQAERDADAANEDREAGDPEVEPDQWQGEDYHATKAAAEADFNAAVGNVHEAVGDFGNAAQNCAQAIHEAGNDDLKNESGLFASIGRAWDAAMEVLDVIVQILEVVVMVLAIVALFVPGLNVLVLALTIAVAIGTVLLAMSGKRTWWEAGAAVLSAATMGVGRYLDIAAKGATTAAQASRLQNIKLGMEITEGFVDIGPDGPSLNLTGGLINAGLKGGVDKVVGLNMMQFRGPDGKLDPLSNAANWKWDVPADGVDFSDVYSTFKTSAKLGETLRPGGDQSGLSSFEGLDVAVSPGDIQVPSIDAPGIGPIDIPPMAPIEVPQISIAVDVSAG